MPIDIAILSIEQLENVIENHRRKGLMDSPMCLDARQELEKRRGKNLDFDKSLAIILLAAKQRKFLSYKDLADESGADWGQVRYLIGEHLWRLVSYSHHRHKVLFSSIVVNKSKKESGCMEPDTLKGFIAAARLLDYAVVNEEAFLREQQDKVFEWAKSQPSER